MSPRRKIPTKAELIQLQKLYKTDQKIGERLGSVPAYLVAYWRRKKNVPRYSLPKFSEIEIRSLWERYGDDDRCGLELGISKAAFYSWRRRYGIREKPPFLKLEQLELNFPDLKSRTTALSQYGKQAVAQKILARAANKEKVEVGELVEVEPDIVISHANTGDIMAQFRKVGAGYVFNPNKIVVSLADCCLTQPPTSAVVSHKSIREFVVRQGIKCFHDNLQGNCHQVAIEHGHILPGQLIFGADRHTGIFGALGAFAAGLTTMELATVWASGKMWLQVPATLRIDINGRRPRTIHACDIALAIINRLGSFGAEYRAIEYYGSAASQMSISERTTLTNLSVELGAKAAICPYEAITRRYLTGRSASDYAPVIADKDAEYEAIYQINIDRLAPQIAGPNRFDKIRAVAELEELPVHYVILGGCVSGRFEELRIAAEILKAKQVHSDCRMFVIPASRSIYIEALRKGLIRILAEAGAAIIDPGYQTPLLVDRLLLDPGQRYLTTANCWLSESYLHKDAEIYFCSAATAAASSLNAAITDPTRYVG
ncbi:MAG: aconitase family protein, partial [Candidatus Zixiibacteriota bacterium]